MIIIIIRISSLSHEVISGMKQCPFVFPTGAVLACVGLTMVPALADEPQQRYGTVVETDHQIQVEGGFTATLQTSSDERIRDEALASFDLVAVIPRGQGKWTTYIEGNISPRRQGVSILLGEANGDAGSALDRDDKGRLQVSELHYARHLGDNSLTVGLINPAGVLDASAVANDETGQFLGASFVNNPTIAFPDYALGSSLHLEEGNGRPGYNLLLSSSHGLADNPRRSYAQLVDVEADGKGLFLGAEMYWSRAASRWRLGLWGHSEEQPVMDGAAKEAANYGAYLNTDYAVGNSRWNLRLGMANDEVSPAAAFVGLAMETPVAGHTLGAGVARTAVSDQLGGAGDVTQAELYLRVAVRDGLHLTPSIQYLHNSGFDNSGSEFGRGITVYSLRAGYSF
jgi:hypothetical protein